MPSWLAYPGRSRQIGGWPRSRTPNPKVPLVFETSCQPSQRDHPYLKLAEGEGIEPPRGYKPPATA